MADYLARSAANADFAKSAVKAVLRSEGPETDPLARSMLCLAGQISVLSAISRQRRVAGVRHQLGQFKQTC